MPKMSIPQGLSIEALNAFVVDMSIWQTFLFSLWVLNVLVQKFAAAVYLPLWLWFLDSLTCAEVETGGESSVDNDSLHSSIEEVEEEHAGDDLDSSNLIPALPDQVVRERVWPVLMRSPSATQLFRLRCVSRHWSRFVDTTLEWNALGFIMLDMTISGKIVTRSDLGRLAASQLSRLEATSCPFLLSEDMSKIVTHSYLDQLLTAECLKLEVSNYQFLLSEDMREVEERVRYSRLRLSAAPFYVSVEGCPPDAEEGAGYYDL